MKNYTETIDKYIEINKQMAKDFKWESYIIRYQVAMSFAMSEKPYSQEGVISIMDTIKHNTGAFSNYRVMNNFLLSSLLYQNFEHPEERFKHMLDTHQLFKDHHFKESTYLPIANYVLHKSVDEDQYDAVIKKAKLVHEEMKKNHPFLTTGDDYPLAVLVANNDSPVDQSIRRIEDIYQELLNNGFGKNNGTQFLSHILSFSDEPTSTTAKRCHDVIEQLKENKIKVKLYTNYYGSLGFLALLKNESSRAVDDIVDLVDYMKKSKAFRWVDKITMLSLAAPIVIDCIIKERAQDGYAFNAMDIPIDALMQAQAVAVTYMVCCSAGASGAV